MDEKERPARCDACGRSRGSAVHPKCDYCGRLAFYEEILCGLNRGVQDVDAFKCLAFQPILKVINGSEIDVTASRKQETADFRQQFFKNLLETDAYKYLKAISLQKSAQDSDQGIINLRYHLVWNTIFRKPVFHMDSTIIDYCHAIFQENTTFIGGFVYLLWVAGDHVHIFIESDGNVPLDTITKKIKIFSNEAIIKRYPDLIDSGTGGGSIWDEGCFVEKVE